MSHSATFHLSAVLSSRCLVFDSGLWGGNATLINKPAVLCWEEGAEPSGGERMRVPAGAPGPVGALFSGLKPSTPYLVTVRARNSAGLGPASPACNITTKKPPPSQAPGSIEWNLTNSRIFLNWEHVKALENESEVTGYKVVYRETWQGRTRVLETNKTSVEFQVPAGEEEDYLIQIKVLTDGGLGGSSDPIRIPKMSSKAQCRNL
ncbi:hypothetical protein CRUP_016475 [Coryphaenoides rupestris]|nr:hypothetical protein CRUP_016475 [Coryphaenoides rupestris]